MSNKKIGKTFIFTIVFIIALSIIGFLIYSLSDKKNIPTSKDTKYDDSKTINLAINNLKKDGSKAEIITKVKTSDKVFALTFKGLSDTNTNTKILDLVSKHNAKATFFVPGIRAAEDSAFIKKVNSKGLNIGSNTLNGSKHMEKYSSEELVKDFIKTNSIIKNLTKKEPTSLLCNSTKYTDKLLRAAYEAGNKKIVDSTHVLNYQSFKSYDQVLNYVKKIKKGSIITIKVDGVLDEMEYETPTKEEKPAIDKKPDIEVDKEIETLTESERLLNTVKWLLQAIEEVNYKTVFVEDLKSYIDKGSDFKLTKLEVKTMDYYLDYILKQRLSLEKNYFEKSKGNTNTNTNNSKGISTNTKKETDNNTYTKEELDALRQKNNNKKAKESHTIHTTERALGFSFYGISYKEVLDHVISTLDNLNAKGTFFVTERDILNNKDELIKISEKGHEIGISLMESSSKDYYSTLKTILTMQRDIKDITGQNAVLVRYPYEVKISDDVLEAISSAGCTVIWSDLAVASSKLSKDASIDEVINNIFHAGNLFTHRGYVIYYRMDYYSNPKLIGDIVKNITENRINNVAYPNDPKGSAYSVKTLTDLMKSDKVYNYPLEPNDIIPSVRNAIYPGHLENLSDKDKFNFIKDRYIGNPDISNHRTLPGFTDDELALIDTTGVATDDKVLFLTFDDWSSDKPINQLLYVLDKHNVDATFFIRTNYMQNNPNILRAIAESGHDVGSHTDNHLPFALSREQRDENDTSGLYFSLTDDDVQKRKEDLLISYNKLQAVVGDVTINGKPALTKILRPPTLAMSRIGMESIFDMGFSHIVSGDFSTHDYEDSDPNVLADKIINGMLKSSGDVQKIQNGSILVMHMSDGNKYISNEPNITAKALDIAIPILKAQGYRFSKLSDYVSE
ncbi:polysaccharide deacetylase [Gottschalkia acidurici 9a]|uniref:Polysaccharide deacetylase n=1 Tax=Gottschalkia acidurici (strain ATCC 7906 / DSM 604 / BCRC 14475 / CIP 104303 / KCTC 5404 / NCIMB 10678 / 9a) TaxID=1128398 RepID=K0B2E1_GOTA9|nr:polysaccharide deacetylase family protein [Gottschalkia acidurici]AFS79100.1 polysaccharide deacetylase [Gottschalkia acidurici 9a]